MSNIKHLQMCNTICADARIGVSKSFFGLRITATYLPTNSIIDARTFEFSPSDGERLKHILESPRETLPNAIDNFHPTAIVNGNYMAEVCMSRDGAFVAVQLYQFARMSYEPVTSVLAFDGSDAHIIQKLF